MDPELQNIEEALKAFRPAMPGPACMDRLLAAVEGRSQRADGSFKGLEVRLASMTPKPVSAPAESAMLSTVSKVPFPISDKVVLFPGAAKSGNKPQSRRPWFAAAAAVAVAGAFSAMMIDPSTTAKSGRAAIARENTAPAVAPEGFVPASIGSGFEDAKDEGVVWMRDGKPMRKVRVIYMDRFKYHNERGEVVEFERPRVEILMVPEKID